MKHDINLLQKKKATQYSGKKLGTVLLIILVFAALLYAGITLPSNSLSNAQIRLADLNNQISVQSTIDQELTEKTQRNVNLQEALKQLEALNTTRQDVAKYMEAVESSLPTSAYITYIEIADNEMTINGITPRDEVLATFALRLRETQVFNSVLINGSANESPDSPIVFKLTAVLPAMLSDMADVTDGSDSNDKADSGNSDNSENSDGSNGSGQSENGDALIADDGANTVASADTAGTEEVNQ